jgi:hypothetical protein
VSLVKDCNHRGGILNHNQHSTESEQISALKAQLKQISQPQHLQFAQTFLNAMWQKKSTPREHGYVEYIKQWGSKMDTPVDLETLLATVSATHHSAYKGGFRSAMFAMRERHEIPTVDIICKGKKRKTYIIRVDTKPYGMRTHLLDAVAAATHLHITRGWVLKLEQWQNQALV